MGIARPQGQLTAYLTGRLHVVAQDLGVPHDWAAVDSAALLIPMLREAPAHVMTVSALNSCMCENFP